MGLATALAMVLSACAMATQTRRNAHLRHELDEVRIDRPLEKTWPVVLQLLADHGYQLVGQDRVVVGAPSASVFQLITGGGFETGKTDHGLVVETMPDAWNVRHRAEGSDLDGKTCQVRFTAIKFADASPTEERSRDLDLELELVKRLDPEQAKRIELAAGAAR